MMDIFQLKSSYLTLYHKITTFNDPVTSNLSIVRKGENAGKQHFLLFLQRFLLFPRQNLLFGVTFICRLKNSLSLD